MIIVAATGNKGKIRELREILGDLGEVLSSKEIGYMEEPEENGLTFTENAFIKADALIEYLRDKLEYTNKDIVVIADDSGLCVDAMEGRPGIYSARYGGENITDSQRVDKLLNEMKDIPAEKRKAKFVCAAVAVCSDGRRFSETGEVYGIIMKRPAGNSGFGYDPVFYHEGYGRSFGELTDAEKNIVSHRGKAFRKLEQHFSKLNSLNIVLVEPEIPQNTGTIARTCAATGARLHMVRPLGFEITDKYLKRAGLDYWSDVNISYYDSLQELIDRFPRGRFYYASTKSLNTYADVRYSGDTFLVFGKETEGLPEELLLENKDKCIRIPMRENIRSLNLSNAVNIIVYEVYRQNNFDGLCEEGKLTRFSWDE